MDEVLPSILTAEELGIAIPVEHLRAQEQSKGSSVLKF
jgi:hypothetical protein